MRRRALPFLLGRSSGKSWASGEVMIEEAAVVHLAWENIAFIVEGQATYDRILRVNQAASSEPAPVV